MINAGGLINVANELQGYNVERAQQQAAEIYDITTQVLQIASDEEITTLLDAVNTAYKRDRIHMETTDEYKEFKTGRRYCWAQDRVM